MTNADKGVLLVDWENLAGAILGRGKLVERSQVDDLWRFASGRCGDQLNYAHMAAAKFDPTIAAAMRERMIDPKPVHSTKEQADILITVLAMDYLHAGVGHFFLVTGDQDFIPLIERLHRDGRTVTVIYGDPRRLSEELQKTLTTPGVDAVDIAEITTLRERPVDTGWRSLIGLLELQRRGHILGGAEKGERTGLLAGWGVLENEDENHYWALIGEMTEKVVRPQAAIRAPNNEWLPQNATRTYLKLSGPRLADVMAVDHALRRIASRSSGVSLAGLRVGPFQTDDGTLLGRALDALQALGLVRRGADGTYAPSGAPLPLGYLEELWRVSAGLTAECYRRKVASIPYAHLEALFNRGGIGQGAEQRSAGRIKQALKYARAVGVLDVVSVDRRRHAIAPECALSRPFEQGYHELYRHFAQQLDTPVAQQEVHTFMESKDGNRVVPVYGFDHGDRQRILRILSQANLITWRNNLVTFKHSAWGDAGVVPGR